MVHRVRCPHGRAVARRAIVWKLLRHMVWIAHLLEVGLVTLVAIRVDQPIITVHMARLALHRRVRSRQRETGRAVIKRGTRPVRG